MFLHVKQVNAYYENESAGPRVLYSQERRNAGTSINVLLCAMVAVAVSLLSGVLLLHRSRWGPRVVGAPGTVGNERHKNDDDKKANSKAKRPIATVACAL